MTDLTIAATNDVLAAVRTLAPVIERRAEEIEQRRRIPLDLVERLVAAGCFRIEVPRSHGGDELGFPAKLRVIEELAAADASVAWTVVIGGAAPMVLALLPRATFDGIYAAGPDVILAGAFNPTGVATSCDGGYRLTGRWSFVSGCQHSDWFIGHSVVDDNPDLPPRMMLIAVDDIEVVDTWSVSGLCGTGSHDVVVDDVFVPDDHTFGLGDTACIDTPLHRIPELTASTLSFAAVAVGIARGALDDIVSLAASKVPAFGASILAANPTFRHDLGGADADLRAAQALLTADAERAWSMASEGRTFSDRDRARMRASAVWVIQTAAAVVDAAHSAGGATSIRLTSPLQRRFRDIHALTQHFAVKDDTYTMVGAVLANQDVDLTFL